MVTQTILKRLLAFENPWIRLYTLKLIKSLVKFLGRKWRTSKYCPNNQNGSRHLPEPPRAGNMKIISEVYMHVRPIYMDDWLSTTFVENDNSVQFEV